MNLEEKFKKIKSINDRLAKDCLLNLSTYIETNANEADRMNFGKVCEMLADRILELENKGNEKEYILIDYILNNIHSCPFEDECGIDFEKECVGFCEEGCKECIYRNIDKLRGRQ